MEYQMYVFSKEPLEKVPEPNDKYYVSPYKQTANFTLLMKLVLCVKYNNKCVDAISEIIRSNPKKINEQSSRGFTPLMVACINAHTYSNMKAIELLLNCPNVDINVGGESGFTALQYFLFSEMNHIDNIKNNSKNAEHNDSTEHNANIESTKLFSHICELFLSKPNIYIGKNTLKILIKKDVSYTELLMSRIFCPLKFDFDIVAKILKNHSDKYKFLYYCNLHTNVKKEILKNISIHRDELYWRPNSIIALCSEINFKLNFKNSKQVFEEIDDKLKFLFDIRDKDNMIKKISFYL